MRTLCLNMIVKNEEKIIKRVLESVKPYIDYWVICDTGSTDSTIDIIKTTLSDIPGELISELWQNFGYNRTYSLQHAKNKADYILLIDSDMELIVVDSNFKEKLNADMYKIRQCCPSNGNITFSYYNVRLLKGNNDYEYIGRTHEYVECKKDSHIVEELDTIFMYDYADGNNRSEKFIRDIKLLKQDLEDDSNNQRSMFYLAQSYKDLQNYEEAIIWYTNRINSGGWKEEIWYSKYMIGKCYYALEQYENAIYNYLDAFNYDTSRIEPLYCVVKHFRIEGKQKLAYEFLKIAKQIPYPSSAQLFIDDEIYNYLLDYELSILAYYINDKTEGLITSENLLKKRLPNNINNSVERNLIFYLPQLDYDSLSELKIQLTKPEYNICNPSVVNIDGNLVYNIREVSYTFDIDRNVYIYDDVIETINHLDSNTITYEKTNLYPETIVGFEDVRLISYNHDIWGIATSQMTNQEHMNEMILFKLDDKYEMTNILRLKGYEDSKCQKNWMPIIYNDSMCFVYSFDPFIVLCPNLNTGLCTIVKNKQFGFNMTQYRGSSQFINYKNGYLGIIHTVIFVPYKNDFRRKYIHRFVYLDSDLETIKISNSFYLKQISIEFVCGLAMINDMLYISFGFEDKQAYVATISSEKVLNMLLSP